MGIFANPETLFDNSTNGPTVEQALQQMRDNQRAIMELEGAKPTEVCTISTTNINTNGTIYPSSAEVVVTLPENTNSLSAVLTDISPSYERMTGAYEVLHDGMVVSLKSEFSSYQIELVSSETLRLKTAERITLSHLYPLKLKLVLGNNGDYYWEEVPNAGTHSGDITSISGDLDVSGKIRSNGVLLEKKLALDSTPIYDVTLAEDAPSTTIQFDLSTFNLQNFLARFNTEVSETTYNVTVTVTYSDGESIKCDRSAFYYAGAKTKVNVLVYNTLIGTRELLISSTRTNFFGASPSTTLDIVPANQEATITELKLSSAGTLKAGSTITIYAIKDAE